MRPLRALLIVLLLSVPGLVWAEGQQFTGTCNALSWNANTEVDLAGYRLYDRVSLASSKTLIAAYGIQTTSVSCATLGLNTGQHYLSLTAFDTSGNESQANTEVPFVLIQNAVTDLRVTVVNATDMTLAFTEVDGGDGLPASYDIRLATPTVNWGTAASVASGTCTSPVSGTTIGATKTCTVTGLSATTPYQFQLVPYRGSPPTAVFGPLSNIVGATTGGSVPATARTLLASDVFDRADGGLGVDWSEGYTVAGGAFAIVSNAVRAGTANAAIAATYTQLVPPDRQWASLTFTTIAGSPDRYATVLLRASEPPTLNAYEFGARLFAGGCWSLTRFDSNVPTQLTQDCSTAALTAGETLLVEADGATLNLYRVSSGGTETLVLTWSDAVLAAGRAGMLFWTASPADVIATPFAVGSFESPGADVCGCDNH